MIHVIVAGNDLIADSNCIDKAEARCPVCKRIVYFCVSGGGWERGENEPYYEP